MAAAQAPLCLSKTVSVVTSKGTSQQVWALHVVSCRPTPTPPPPANPEPAPAPLLAHLGHSDAPSKGGALRRQLWRGWDQSLTVSGPLPLTSQRAWTQVLKVGF